MLVELIGYLGSALVVVSMLMTSVVRLRVINLIGSAIFTGYALTIRSYPTAAMNLFLVGINIFHLIRLLKDHKHYELIRTSLGDGYFRYIYRESLEDIHTWFPEFSLPEASDIFAALVCCDNEPAGLFIARELEPGVLEVLLDYSTPVYRDASVGRFLHAELAREGYRRLIFRGNAPRHEGYMTKIGYQKNGEGAFELVL